VEAWLDEVCGLLSSCETGQDLVYAVSEAVANSIGHAYDGRSGTVTVSGRNQSETSGSSRSADGEATGCRGERSAELVVSDRGRWKEPLDDPGDRGRGLLMIEAYVDDVDVSRSEGATVRMRRVLDCAPDAAAA
jgi:anti-sigma regulatory factor (Ser/Thr protein kinase)